MSKTTILKNSIRSFLIIGMGVQIVYGMIWMFGNLREFSLLYLVQLILAFFSGSVFFAVVGKGFKQPARNIFASLTLLTIPMLMQCHMMKGPYSLLISAFLILLSLCYGVCTGEKECNSFFFIKISFLWFLMALLNNDFVWLGSVPVISMWILSIRRKQDWKRASMVILLSVVLIPTFLSSLPFSAKNVNPPKSFASSMVSRIVWPNFGSDYYFWPDEVKEVMGVDKAIDISSYPDKVQNVFIPMIEETYGHKKAKELFLKMSYEEIRIRTKDTLTDMGKDLKAYACTPWSMQNHLKGQGMSLSGWNYENMTKQMPKWTKWYVYYSLYWFRIMFLYSIGYVFYGFIIKKRAPNNTNHSFTIITILCGVSQVIWYTMESAGMMDYLNTTLVTVLWYIFVLFMITNLWYDGEIKGNRRQENGKRVTEKK